MEESNDDNQSDTLSRFLMLPIDLIAYLTLYLDITDMHALISSNEELKIRCAKIGLLERRAKEYVMKEAPLYAGSMEPLEHALLIERDFRTMYCNRHYDSYTYFGSCGPREGYAFSLKGLPPPSGTIIHVIFNADIPTDIASNYSYHTYSSQIYFSEQSMYEILKHVLKYNYNKFSYSCRDRIMWEFIQRARNRYFINMTNDSATRYNMNDDESKFRYYADELETFIVDGDYGETNKHNEYEFVYLRVTLP